VLLFCSCFNYVLELILVYNLLNRYTHPFRRPEASKLMVAACLLTGVVLRFYELQRTPRAVRL